MGGYGRSNAMLWGRLWTIISVVAFFVGSSMEDLVQSYCSGQNTGAANFVENYTFQSNGYCSDKCRDQFAFAVVQGQACWCSNYIPASQQSVSRCGDKCPGYPMENCGSAANNVFGYVALDKSPSGTAKGSSVPPTVSIPASISTPSGVVIDSGNHGLVSPVQGDRGVSQTKPSLLDPNAMMGLQEAPLLFNPLSNPLPSPRLPALNSPVLTQSMQAAPKSSNPPSLPKTTSVIVDMTVTQEERETTSYSSSKPSPITSMQVVTISGSVMTQTVTTMPTTSPERVSQKQKLSNGAVIATAVAAIIAVVAVLAAVVIGLFCWRRRQGRSSFEHNRSDAFPQRNPSVLSKAGLLGGHGSSNGLSSYDNVSPISERRSSKPLIFDQRLNPNAFMQHDDGSRTSVLTMQDNQDYTRTLNVRNPDPIARI